jgi:hypothetical protein
MPVIALEEGRPSPFTEYSGTIVPMPLNSRREMRYRQVVPQLPDAARLPAGSLWRGPNLERLRRQEVHGLEEWTSELLHQLAQDARYHLNQNVREVLTKLKPPARVPPAYWETVAILLNEYLSSSGEFTYSLELTRKDWSLDPVMDFLLHMRQGHCERFATALALMLRSVGIPSRVVKGYRGVESQGEGLYYVRHRHAHAWVEILVPRRNASAAEYDWRTLDPTPATATTSFAPTSLAKFWKEGQRITVELWRTLIIDYNAEEQADLVYGLGSVRLPKAVKRGIYLLLACALLGGLVLVRRLLRRRRLRTPRPAAPLAFYARLQHLLERYAALRSSVGQTPREYGQAAAQALRLHPGLASLAEVPGYIIAVFYRVRFGGLPLNEQEKQEVSTQLDRFAEMLRRERKVKTEPRP